MTLQSSGAISFQDLKNETGQPAGFSASMQWVKDNGKTAKGGTTGVINDMNTMHDKAYYQDNNSGNCNNGNCTNDCNCGNVNCFNCVITGAVNCTNCDTKAYLQPNCNCNCTYNCTTGQVSHDCDCACPWICACW
jgi:hypothetical protein